jgi:NAD(P)-dependent dehydrogenase (short-subunit alcohol dehydrogenase family)
MLNLKGKTVVLTGAASGIGRALAIQLAKEGCGLVLVDWDEEGLRQTGEMADLKSRPLSQHVMDIGQREPIFSLADFVSRERGGADILINNAGIAGMASFLEVPLDMMERFMQVNFWGAVYGCKAFLPQLLDKPEAHIVNVSSIEGILAFPQKTAYDASKFALRGFTEALKLDLGKTRVGVSCVFPGGIRTNIARNAFRLSGQYLEEHPELKEALAPRLADGEAKVEMMEAFLTTPAEEAAGVIIEGIKNNSWRILIGEDARGLDELQRTQPEAYPEILAQIWPKELGWE